MHKKIKSACSLFISIMMLVEPMGLTMSVAVASAQSVDPVVAEATTSIPVANDTFDMGEVVAQVDMTTAVFGDSDLQEVASEAPTTTTTTTVNELVSTTTVTVDSATTSADVILPIITAEVGSATSVPMESVSTTTVDGSAQTIQSYTITALAGVNGSINPSGKSTVLAGSSQILSIIPNSGYSIADVIVDGISIGAVETYQFSNIVADHTLVASFSPETQLLQARDADSIIQRRNKRITIEQRLAAAERLITTPPQETLNENTLAIAEGPVASPMRMFAAVAAATIPLTPPTSISGLAMETTINLSWSPATGGTAPFVYDVLRNGISVGTTTVAGFVDVNLTPATSYSYVIRATDSALVTADSVVTTIATLAIPAQGGTPNYFGPEPNWAFSPPLRKFVDTLPGLTASSSNNLGQYIPVGVPDTVTYPGSDYYEIELGQYTEQMHSDLKPTTLRGYRQTNVADPTVSKFHYLGPQIIAQKDRPVRIKFTNKLPIGVGGDLFLPVDKTIMGAGMGPLMMNVTPGNQMYYTENRATLHLHGGLTPWISDGTQHQWITPAGENTDYPEGVSVQNVPDMPDPGPGAQTFYYTNQQSARLMFYHDHSYGITRLNVYAGEAAGYIIEDQTEKDLVARGIIPAVEIPLIIQDKTFIDPTKILSTDPTWPFAIDPNKSDLWYPHVYMPNQNPNDMSGVNAMGRWDYGPWFWPVWPVINQPITYPDGTKVPNLPNISAVMEGFMDTPLINGTAYPTVTVDPKSYRFRILNASDDRFWNLQLYQAATSTPMWNPDGTLNNADAGEVPMIPALAGAAAWPANWPAPDGRVGGLPNPAFMGPDMIQIGTEGGFLPKPVTLSNIPIGWDADPKSITVGNIKEHNLFLGPAERADVIVDFSAYAGKTLILYNDGPAAVPALDPRLDYYTGNPDLTSVGGTTTTLPGYGPNIRTIMQIKVATSTPAPAFDRATLDAEFASTPTKQGVFERSQNTIIVPQDGYNSAYNAAFPSGTSAYARIQDTSLTFTPKGATAPTTIGFKPKAIAEEFEDAYGRMSAFLGVEMPFSNGMNQTTIFYTVKDPSTEIMNETINMNITPIGSAGDGTQLWKITHNGVDTHAMHFHLFDVQVVNRVDWAGVVKPPEPNELGWKDTVRMNPLEDIIVAMRPVTPTQPFGLPNSIRALDPTMPIGDTMGFKNVDPLTGNPITVTNQLTNFGWEYVWHCHILAHEEMDMMRPIVFNVKTTTPAVPVATEGPAGVVQWTDATPVGNIATMGDPTNEIGFRIDRATVDVNGTVGAYAQIGTALANQTSFTDTTATPGTTYSYIVTAYNAAGSVASPPTIAQQGGPIMVTMALSPGWNMISLPVQPTDQAGQPINYTAETFGQLAGVDVVVGWSSAGQQYSSHIVGLPMNDFPLASGVGFFAHSATTTTVGISGTAAPYTVPIISPGWNLLGWASAVATTADAFGKSIVGADVIAKFDSVLQQWTSHIVNFPINDFPISPGDGIFVHKP